MTPRHVNTLTTVRAIHGLGATPKGPAHPPAPGMSVDGSQRDSTNSRTWNKSRTACTLLPRPRKPHSRQPEASHTASSQVCLPSHPYPSTSGALKPQIDLASGPSQRLRTNFCAKLHNCQAKKATFHRFTIQRPHRATGVRAAAKTRTSAAPWSRRRAAATAAVDPEVKTSSTRTRRLPDTRSGF